MSDDFQVEIMKEKEQLKEENISYGHWSVDGAFFFDTPWDDIAEDEGIGRGPDDTFQEEMAERLANTGGALVFGRGGTGKSNLIKLLKTQVGETRVQGNMHCLHPRCCYKPHRC